MEHVFIAVEEVKESEKSRVVKPVTQWWMADQYKRDHGGELPKDMVSENAWWDREALMFAEIEEQHLKALNRIVF
jgi:hypothetical protein